jgi:hypothetical protein
MQKVLNDGAFYCAYAVDAADVAACGADAYDLDYDADAGNNTVGLGDCITTGADADADADIEYNADVVDAASCCWR